MPNFQVSFLCTITRERQFLPGNIHCTTHYRELLLFRFYLAKFIFTTIVNSLVDPWSQLQGLPFLARTSDRGNCTLLNIKYSSVACYTETLPGNALALTSIQKKNIRAVNTQQNTERKKENPTHQPHSNCATLVGCVVFKYSS